MIDGPFGKDTTMDDSCPNCNEPLGDHSIPEFMHCGDTLNASENQQ